MTRRKINYPHGYVPQTYGEEKMADQMTEKEIQREIDKKKKMKKEDPEKYHAIYCGT